MSKIVRRMTCTLLVAFAALTFPAYAISVASLTEKQVSALQAADVVGNEYGLGHVLQGIILQESHAGAIQQSEASRASGCFGIAQMKVKTAIAVLLVHPELAEQFFTGRSVKTIKPAEVKTALIRNQQFALSVAAAHLFDLKRVYKTWSKALVAYNLGVGGVQRISNPVTHPYARSVMLYVREMKQRQDL